MPSLRNIIHSRVDLPRLSGLEVTRDHSATVYLDGLAAFEAWREALDRSGPVEEAGGWRYCAGWLHARTPASVTVGDTVTDGWIIDPEVKALVTLMVRHNQEGSDQ